MKKSEIYVYISAFLFIAGMAIIPVGGMAQSNPYHNYYFYGFLAIELNLIVSIIVMLYHSKTKEA